MADLSVPRKGGVQHILQTQPSLTSASNLCKCSVPPLFLQHGIAKLAISGYQTPYIGECHDFCFLEILSTEAESPSKTCGATSRRRQSRTRDERKSGASGTRRPVLARRGPAPHKAQGQGAVMEAALGTFPGPGLRVRCRCTTLLSLGDARRHLRGRGNAQSRRQSPGRQTPDSGGSVCKARDKDGDLRCEAQDVIWSGSVRWGPNSPSLRPVIAMKILSHPLS